jgi:hypothetical protein
MSQSDPMNQSTPDQTKCAECHGTGWIEDCHCKPFQHGGNCLNLVHGTSRTPDTRKPLANFVPCDCNCHSNFSSASGCKHCTPPPATGESEIFHTSMADATAELEAKYAKAETVEAPVKALPTADYNSNGVDMTYAATGEADQCEKCGKDYLYNMGGKTLDNHVGCVPLNAKNPTDKSEVSSKQKVVPLVTNNNTTENAKSPEGLDTLQSGSHKSVEHPNSTTADPLSERVDELLGSIEYDVLANKYDQTEAKADILALIREELTQLRDMIELTERPAKSFDDNSRNLLRQAVKSRIDDRINQLNNEVNPNE